MKANRVAVVTKILKEFACPFCGQTYYLAVDEDDNLYIEAAGGNKGCPHLEIDFIYPANSSKYDSNFKVYFAFHPHRSPETS